MYASPVSRLVLFSLVSVAIHAGLLVSPSAGAGSVVIGETRRVEVEHKATAGLDAMKAQYRRPASIPFPDNNPYTLKKASLGKKLYFDTRLSLSSAQSCASCHNPSFSWGDGLAVGVGNGMVRLKRRSPTIINSAWGVLFMWDGLAANLEEQTLGPIQSPEEMNMPVEELMRRLAAVSGYDVLFKDAFPRIGLNPDTLAQAIATYERTVVSGHAPFDSWVDGDERAISEQAKHGFLIFNTRGQCSSCHEGWNFTDDGFHDIGLPTKDIGRARFLPTIPKMLHAFKTPGLREIANRAPYMHDGSIATLEQVIEHYDRAAIARPSRSELIAPLDLSSQDKADLVEFLKTLAGPPGSTVVPTLPR